MRQKDELGNSIEVIEFKEGVQCTYKSTINSHVDTGKVIYKENKIHFNGGEGVEVPPMPKTWVDKLAWALLKGLMYLRKYDRKY